MESKVGYKRIILAVFFILATVMLQILAVKAQMQEENPLCEEHFGHPCTPGSRPCCAHTGRQCVAAPFSNGFHCQ